MKLIPPSNLRPVESIDAGSIRFLPRAPRWTRKRIRMTGAQKAGKAYEKKVLRSLENEYPGYFQPHVWVRAQINGETRELEMDGLLVNKEIDTITIIEVKLKHTLRAWWQLRRLYQPVMVAAFPNMRIQVCEVYKLWDISVVLPEPLEHCPGEPGRDTDAYKVCLRDYR